MPRKRCPLMGGEYDEGSFSDIIHQYIYASTSEDLDGLKKEIIANRLDQLQRWSEGVLWEFVPHFKERFRDIDVDSEEWDLEIDKWNWMGLILGQLRAFKWSEEIYRALYDLLVELQSSKGRINKGTPLHQIGWVDLLRGTPESIRRSIYYMKLAMIEDKLTFDTEFKNNPAYKVLKGEHNLSETRLDRLSESVETYRAQHTGNPCLRPELIYLEYVIDRRNEERSSLYDLDSKLAEQLMYEVQRDTTPNQKGENLEILMAYLFSTSPGFEVLRNLISFDGQIDLLVRNLNTSDPVLGEFGKYIIVECRNIKEKADAKSIRDFAAKVVQASSNSGIIVTKRGITGDKEKEVARDARMTILKIHQRHGVVIVPLTIDQLEPIIEKQVPLLNLLVSEYEKIRFDLT